MMVKKSNDTAGGNGEIFGEVNAGRKCGKKMRENARLFRHTLEIF